MTKKPTKTEIRRAHDEDAAIAIQTEAVELCEALFAAKARGLFVNFHLIDSGFGGFNIEVKRCFKTGRCDSIHHFRAQLKGPVS